MDPLTLDAQRRARGQRGRIRATAGIHRPALERFELSVEVPANTRATVRLPKAEIASVTESGRPLADGNGIRARRQEGDVAVVEIGSGQYRFVHTPSN